MNAQTDSLQTCPYLIRATSPAARRVVFLVNVVPNSTCGLQNGAHAARQIWTTVRFVEARRSVSLSGLLTYQLLS